MITWQNELASTNWTAATFVGGKKWIPAARRLSRQIKEQGLVREFIAFDNEWLKSQKRPGIQNRDIEEIFPRGFGLWHWKPLVIKAALLQSENSTGVIYLDAGCEINSTILSNSRMLEYLDIAEKTGGLAFSLDVIDSDFSSSIVREIIPSQDTTSENQISATVLFLPNNSFTHNFLGQWNYWCCYNDYALLKGYYEEKSTFHNHRHDQSILSALWKQNNLRSIPDETYWSPNWKRKGKKFPIWALRNKSQFSFKTPRFPRIILRFLEKVLISLSKHK